MKENLGKHNGAEWMCDAKTWIEETYKSNGELREFIDKIVLDSLMERAIDKCYLNPTSF